MFAIATVVAVVIIDPVIMGILFLLLYWMGAKAIDRKHLNKNLRVLVVIFLTFSMFQILFFTLKDLAFPVLFSARKTVGAGYSRGIIRGVAVFFRFFSVVLSVHLMLYSTPPVDLVLAFTRRTKTRDLLKDAKMIAMTGILLSVMAYLSWSDKIQKIPLGLGLRVLVVTLVALLIAFIIQRLAARQLPPEMGVALTLGFATVGILSQQTQKITDAQKARGYDVQPKNIIRSTGANCIANPKILGDTRTITGYFNCNSGAGI